MLCVEVFPDQEDTKGHVDRGKKSIEWQLSVRAFDVDGEDVLMSFAADPSWCDSGSSLLPLLLFPGGWAGAVCSFLSTST